MPEPNSKLFISHASEDKPEYVKPLVEALRRRGVACWLDDDEILPGENIPKEIGEALKACPYVVVVLSPKFVTKHYAQDELLTAINQQASTGEEKLIPVLVGSADERRATLELFPQLGKIKGVVWEGGAEPVAEAICRRVKPSAAAVVSSVCFISSEYPPKLVGGLGVHVDQLTKALAEHMKVDVVLASPDKEGYQTPPGVHLHTLADVRPTYEDTISWLEFANHAADRIMRVLARDSRPDVIHCHDWVTALAGIKCRWRLGIPLVFHLHLPNRAPLCASVENLALVSADLVTVNSESMRVALDYRQLPLPPVEVIKNGVDTEAFVPSEKWPEDDGYILFVGRLVQQKGVEHLLRAFYCVKGKFPDVRLKIVGRGELKSMLKALCRNLMLTDQVEFVDWCTGPALAELYQKARVVVVPSIYEPFGMTALEAMACKRPVVASYVGGLQDIIRHGVTGFHAQPRDDLDLAQWIMALLASPARRHSMGEAGRAQILSEGYTWPQIARRFIQRYESLRGKPVVRERHEKSFEFEKQIREAATHLKRSLDRSVLDELFRWEA